MRSIVVLLFIFFAFLFTLKSSVIGMLVYWWFAIFRPQDWIYMDVSSFKLPLLAITLFIPPALIRGYRPKLTDRIAKLMIAWVLLSVIASITVGCPEQFWLVHPYSQMTILMIAVLLSADIVKTKAHLVYWIGTVGLSLGFYAGKSGLLALSRGGSSTYGASNLGGLFSGSNAYASGSAVLVFFIILVYQVTKHKEVMSEFPYLLKKIPVKLYQSVLFLVIVGTIFNVISLESRASAIAMILAFLLFYGLSNNKAFLKMFLWAPVVVFALSMAPLPDGYEERIQSVFADEEKRDNSASSRPYFWNIAAQMASDQPMGVGANCYKAYYGLYDTEKIHGKYRDVHSSHFQVLSETGYLGLAVWLWLHALCFFRNNKIRKQAVKHYDKMHSAIFYKQISIMLMCSQLVFFISGSFYSMAFNDLIWIIFGLTIAQTKLFNQELDKIKQDVD